MKSLSALARELGVSTTVVSHVYNGKWKERRVSEKLALRIQEAIRREGCRPSSSGIQLKTGRSMMIGVMLPDLSVNFGLDILRGVEGVMTPSGFMMLLSSTRLGATEEETLAATVARGVDGIISSPHLAVEDYRKALSSPGRDIPMVFVDNWLPGAGIDFAATDNRQGSAGLVKRLFAAGRRRIGYIGAAKQLRALEERHKGYLEGLAICGLPEDKDLVSRTLSSENEVPEALNAVLKAKPDALFVESLQYFKSGFEMLDIRKIKVPDDIMLAGFDTSAYKREGIISCIQDGEAIGRLAASRLKELIIGGKDARGPAMELFVEPKFG